MRRDSTFCAKSVRYNIFTNGAPYLYLVLASVVQGDAVNCNKWRLISDLGERP